jgi:hypothetical protein
VEMKEQEQMGRFLEHALTENVGTRRRFAQYFSNVTRSSELRTRWGEYLRIVEIEYQDTKNELEKADEDVKKYKRILV